MAATYVSRSDSGLSEIQKPGRRPGFLFCARAQARGFSLVELIVVIVVAGIIAATVLPRFGGRHGFEERGFRDETVLALRYAQKAAIALRRPVCATFTAAQLTINAATPAGAVDCTVATPLVGARGVALVVNAPAGSSYTAFPAGGIAFSPLGAVAGAAAVSVYGLPAALAITVEAGTGYVH